MAATNLRGEVPLPMEYINWHTQKKYILSPDVQTEAVVPPPT